MAERSEEDALCFKDQVAPSLVVPPSSQSAYDPENNVDQGGHVQAAASTNEGAVSMSTEAVVRDVPIVTATLLLDGEGRDSGVVPSSMEHQQGSISTSFATPQQGLSAAETVRSAASIRGHSDALTQQLRESNRALEEEIERQARLAAYQLRQTERVQMQRQHQQEQTQGSAEEQEEGEGGVVPADDSKNITSFFQRPFGIGCILCTSIVLAFFFIATGGGIYYVVRRWQQNRPKCGNLVIATTTRIDRHNSAELFRSSSDSESEDRQTRQRQPQPEQILTLPSCLFQLTRLTHLSLSQSNLNGRLPTSVASLSQLTWLNLSHNSFSGTLPSLLLLSPSLQYVSLYDNALTGSIPNPPSDLSASTSALVTLDLQDNLLTGTVPVGWTNAVPNLLLDGNEGLIVS